MPVTPSLVSCARASGPAGGRGRVTLSVNRPVAAAGPLVASIVYGPGPRSSWYSRHAPGPAPHWSFWASGGASLVVAVSSTTYPSSAAADITIETESPARPVKLYSCAKLPARCGAAQLCWVSESLSCASSEIAAATHGWTTNATGITAGLPAAFPADTITLSL